MSRAGVQQETGSLGHVLFGIFALQMDFISREQLAAAMSAPGHATGHVRLRIFCAIKP